MSREIKGSYEPLSGCKCSRSQHFSDSFLDRNLNTFVTKEIEPMILGKNEMSDNKFRIFEVERDPFISTGELLLDN
jgi:hypothetical protein